MRRSYLEKVFFKKATTGSLKKYKKHKDFCSRLYKKGLKKSFGTLDVQKIKGNKAFRKQSNLFFPHKITLEDSQKTIISDDTLVSQELSNFFQNGRKN